MKKYCMLLLTVLILLSGCTKRASQEPGETDTLSVNGNAEITPEEVESEYELNVHRSNVYSLDQTIVIDGFEFKNMEVNFMKALPEGLTKDDIIYFYEEANEDGALTSDDSYIFAPISIKNTNKEEQMIALSCGTFDVYNENNDIVASNSELRYRSDYKGTDGIKKDYYLETFRPDEEKKILLGYVVPDEMLEQDNLYYTINLWGNTNDDESLMAYKIR